MDPYALALIGVLVLVIGVVLGALLTHSRIAAKVEAAVERARAEASAEAAKANAQANAAVGELTRERAEHAKTRSESNEWREKLDSVSDERARFEERARHADTLEAKVNNLNETIDRLNQSVQELTGKRSELSAQLEAERAALGEARRDRDELKGNLEAANEELKTLRETAGANEVELKNERNAHERTASALGEVKSAREDAVRKLGEAERRVAELTTALDAERKQAAEKLTLLMQAKEALSDQFKSIAADLLDEKSKKFTEQNETNIGKILDPLKEKIGEFQKKVEDVYDKENKDRSALGEQVRHLMQLNQTLSTDAKNLTSALKGSSKTQGNWGEMLLERLLEHAGLQKGPHYEVQENQHREDGSRAQPDFVLKLPNERRMVVDSKVSLVAYDRYQVADSDADKALALKQHVDSVRAHMKGLSEKNYQNLYKLQSMDFVVMFMPIEPAFTLAATNDATLFDEALAKNVLIVTNSTLLFVVRTVAYLWTQDKQNRSAQEIASRGAELYDKLSAFAQELASLGKSLQSAQDHYHDAVKRLSHGRGNVIRQAEMLKGLGVKPTKSLPSEMLDSALSDAAHDEVPALDSTDVKVLEGMQVQMQQAPAAGA